MIPCSVELTNFLSHRCEDEQPVTFDFDGAVLWSVSGDNGAGKSAIFDAISWALFNIHRGGGQDARRLICHGADKCEAAFVFAVGGERYRVQRSVRMRGTAKRTAYQLRAGEWEQIDGTQLENGFADWRHDLLALSYEAFTHSMLLLQGGSDRLIAMKPKDRFKILAEVVELDRYVQLERRCEGLAAEARGQVKLLEGDLAAMPEADPEARKALSAQLEQLEVKQRKQAAAVQAHQAAVAGARAHDSLGRALAQKRSEIASAAQLVENAEQIKADADEHHQLTAIASHLQQALRAHQVREQALAEAHGAKTRLSQTDADSLGQEAATAKADAQTARQAAGRARAVFADMNTVMPSLERAISRREELLQAQAEVAKLGSVEVAKTAAQQGRHALKEARDNQETARAEDDTAQAASHAAQAKLERLEQALVDAAGDEGEMTCPRCGCEVRPDQREQHRTHLQQEFDETKQAKLAAAEAATASRALLDQAGAAVNELIGRCTELEAAQVQTEATAAAVTGKQQAATAALANPQVEVWDDLRAEVLRSGSAEQLGELSEALVQEATAALRHAEKLEQAQAEAEGHAERAAAALAAAEAAQAEQAAMIAERSQEASTQQQLMQAAIANLREPWAGRAAAGDHQALEDHGQRLQHLNDAPEAARRLADAQENLAELRGAQQTLDDQLAEIPAEHRVGEEAAQAALAELEGQAQRTAGQADGARAEVRTLAQREQERREKSEDLTRARETARLAAKLLGLLGRQGLQGELVLRASHHIEVYANETLTALTGGTLALEIKAEQKRGAEEITISACDYAGSGYATDGLFLSGSEKFRVCVALAAAIGKYASGGVAVESLIIDEGFGSLDETGRDQMIEELGRLAGLLKRVIVVSHQGEFHDRSRFPHSYRLVREADTTVVERYI